MDHLAKSEREKKVVLKMIQLYCLKVHGQRQLCDECQELLDYAYHRIDACPFVETKTFCSQCKVHCYSPQMRMKIKAVMRFSGPRLFFSHPWLLFRHMIDSRKSRGSKK